MLNVRFIVKMLGVMFILETFFMLAATVVSFLYRGSGVFISASYFKRNLIRDRFFVLLYGL